MKVPSMTTRIILDVDTGIDDALALLYAVKADGIQLEGITTGMGNVSLAQATLNTLQVLDLANAPAELPVAMGAERPLFRRMPHTAEFIHGPNGLGGFELPATTRKPIDEHAADFIVRKANELGRELTLVFVGRLTNLALALAKDPSIAGKVGRLVLMGGALDAPGNVTPVAEANIWGDPDAAHIVFESGMPITMVGLDVTMKTVMLERHIEQLKRQAADGAEAQAAFIEAILQFYFRAYERQNGFYGSPLHDPLAVAVALDPTLVRTESHYIRVETRGELSAGATLSDRRRAPSATNTDVCVDVESERFIEQFIRVLAQA